MQWSSVPLYQVCIYCLLGDFHESTDTLVQNLFLVFWFLPLFHWH